MRRRLEPSRATAFSLKNARLPSQVSSAFPQDEAVSRKNRVAADRRNFSRRMLQFPVGETQFRGFVPDGHCSSRESGITSFASRVERTGYKKWTSHFENLGNLCQKVLM